MSAQYTWLRIWSNHWRAKSIYWLSKWANSVDIQLPVKQDRPENTHRLYCVTKTKVPYTICCLPKPSEFGCFFNSITTFIDKNKMHSHCWFVIGIFFLLLLLLSLLTNSITNITLNCVIVDWKFESKIQCKHLRINSKMKSREIPINVLYSVELYRKSIYR